MVRPWMRNWAKPSCSRLCSASTSEVIRVMVTPAFSDV
jgi:hypothetical protein